MLSDYSFWTVALGTMIFALATSILGTVTVLTRQSLVGDTLSHAAYPGVILAFMLFQQREPLLLMMGAMLLAYLSYGLVYLIRMYSGHSLLNSLSLVSVSFFSLGLLLKQWLQGNPLFQKGSQAGLGVYLFGQAAFMTKSDLMLIIMVSVLILVSFMIFYPSFKLYLFDRSWAETIGVRTVFLDHLVRLSMVALIAVGLKVVGAVLMSSFLIAPACIGLIWARHYRQMLQIVAVSGVVSAICGTYLSSVIANVSTGASIILVMTGIFLLSLIGKFLLAKGGRYA